MFSALLIGMEGWSSMRCRLIWKLKGTKYNRMFFQLQASTLPTEEIGSGLLPTITASFGERGGKINPKSNHDTEKAFRGLLLTPTSVMTDEPPEKMRERAERNGYKNGTQYGSLLSQVKYSEMLPTPTTQDYKRRGPNSKQQGISNTENWVGMLPTPTTDSATNRKENYKQGGTPLSVAMNKMLPTPTTRDWKGKQANEYKQDRGEETEFKMQSLCGVAEKMAEPTSKPSQLNPQFVEEMMGFPENWTASPFQSGETNQSKPTGTQ
jgi:hypothetical protein